MGPDLWMARPNDDGTGPMMEESNDGPDGTRSMMMGGFDPMDGMMGPDPMMMG